MRSNRCLEPARSGWWSAHKVNKTLFAGSWLAATLAGGPPPFKARVTTRLATVGSTSSSAPPHLRFALCACQPPNGFMSATARHAGSDDTILQELKLWMPRPLQASPCSYALAHMPAEDRELRCNPSVLKRSHDVSSGAHGCPARVESATVLLSSTVLPDRRRQRSRFR